MSKVLKCNESCSVDDCDKPIVSLKHLLCNGHYSRFLRGSDVRTPLREKVKVVKIKCSVEGCEKISKYLNGYCGIHYQRWKAHGDPNVLKRNADGVGTIKNGYVLKYRKDKGRAIPEHRTVMESILGRELYHHEEVHHKNGVRNDNRPNNLELWSGSHPSGQRVDDKISWAIEFLEGYGYEVGFKGAKQAA